MAGNFQGPRRGMGGAPRGARMPGQKLDVKVLKRVFSYLLHYKGKFFLALACIVIAALASVGNSISVRYFIDSVIQPMVDNNNTYDGKLMLTYILVMICIYVVSIAATYLQSRIFVTISQGILRDIRNDMFSHMQTLPIQYFDKNTHGDLMSHYTNDTDTLRQLLSQTIPHIISAAMTLIFVFCSILASSLWLTIFVVAFVVLMSIVTSKIAKSSGKYFVEQQEKLGDLNGYVEEMVNGQRVIKVFNHETVTIKDFEEKNEALRESANRANFFGSLMGPVMNNLGHLQYVLLAVIGAIFIGFAVPNVSFTGVSVMTSGIIISFLLLSRSFTQTVNNMMQQASAVVMAMAGASRIFKLLDATPENDEGKVTLVNVKDENGVLTECEEETHLWAWKVPKEEGFELIRLCGDVRMDDVHFSYRENHEILHGITLYAEPGQKVAFVGSTGAGKTTITNLINRFYDIQEGTITYDGIPVREIAKNDLRHSLGIVLQDVNLFTGTIRENIRYGKLNATDEEVVAAAKLANADDFIRRLPEGYDTEIDGTGSQLSQGQRQLISIARAAIQNPPVMILDEATSSIDTRTERIVQRGMDALMKGRTVFVIAHRLSTVQNADVIMVLEKGVIIERGTHESLIEKKGKYYQLYTGAFELE